MSNYGNELSRRSVLKHSALATGSVVLGGVAATGTAAAGIGDGRVLDFHLNNLNYNRKKGEIQGGHVHDASPEQNHGYWANSTDPVIDEGAVGNAYDLESLDQDIEVNDDASLNVTTTTVATWLRFTADANYHFFLSKRGSGGEEYQMYYRGNGPTQPNTLAYYNGSDIWDVSLDLTSDTWHHLAWVVDDDGFTGYHNGQEVATVTEAEMPPGSGTSPVRVGTDANGRYAEGQIDEVRIYDRALSSAEVTDLYEMRDG